MTMPGSSRGDTKLFFMVCVWTVSYPHLLYATKSPLSALAGFVMAVDVYKRQAVTRARKCVTLVGDENTFYEMENNRMEQNRYTTLDLRIKESY